MNLISVQQQPNSPKLICQGTRVAIVAKAGNPAAFLRLDQASPRITCTTRLNSRNASARVSKRQPRGGRHYNNTMIGFLKHLLAQHAI